ncbi:SMC-Scp complex subunit ScpB [Calidifontibacter sp. DB0510]|uniref:SMC-Scp complex subunit ScpB n=1 Tax=Metallococcus carri TaxID=1656884 RepID=A0A967B1C9_9MICO|nr:SMC-Scp complex subunit ScpB [Metallococcus carri]NHN57006.1 SMC-Scp complex subunit ScpB [Metallococcus carri]NOP37751.1 SMC-Scp complex subunit ScpB [Calidifontibacter sp. DB2511S]
MPDPTLDVPVEDPEAFDVEAMPGGARGAIEAILMVVDQPVTALDLADALELEVDDVTAHLTDLEQGYADASRGFMLREINGGWRMYSRPEYAPAVEKFLMGGQQAKLTQASLETLAVIAYRQPISRSRVSAVRGVNVDGVIRTLTTRGLIAEIGADGEGGAMLYGTTPYFLQRLGLSSLDELPALAPYLPDTDVIDELIEQGHG